ncbi:hypothetical protein CEXT_459051 [Caerostris extrusa]|uniref:Uncharacterized protein n=1 Tax=Caerostris extrusa TaxID=172846 RepID=A0AAV4Y7N7_CAEEX|nr:hypothetical protein CEXT_459051 [Caerostris extrusa]
MHPSPPFFFCLRDPKSPERSDRLYESPEVQVAQDRGTTSDLFIFYRARGPRLCLCLRGVVISMKGGVFKGAVLVGGLFWGSVC